MNTVLAADLGGTKCRFALLAADLSLYAVRRVATPRASDAFLAMLESELAACLAAELPPGLEAPRAIGIGTAGVVTRDGTAIDYAPNLPVAGLPLASRLRASLGLPVTLINDGRASAIGEYRHGHAAGRDPLVCLFFGTGIGIGVVAGGKPYSGASNAAGEVGHVLHIPGGRRCACGRRGCYEAYCGGGPMAARAAAELGAAPDEHGWRVDRIVARAADDPRAGAIVADARLAAGALVAALCTLFNPAAVVLGGGVLQGWPALRTDIEAHVRQWCAGAITAGLEFVPSRGESDAVLWGAAEATGAFS